MVVVQRVGGLEHEVNRLPTTIVLADVGHAGEGEVDHVAQLGGAQVLLRDVRFRDVVEVHEYVRVVFVHDDEAVVLGLVEELEAA